MCERNPLPLICAIMNEARIRFFVPSWLSHHADLIVPLVEYVIIGLQVM
jgi:hypothetical protein